MKKIILSVFLFPFINAVAQDTLPNFSVSDKGNNRIVVSWYNNYQETKQISIQRSPDSLNNFKTILTVPDPMNRQNGFMDTKARNNRMFYRLYVHIGGANFLVTTPQRAFSDSLLQAILEKSQNDSSLTADEKKILTKYKNRIALLTDSSAKDISRELKEKGKPDIQTTTFRIMTTRDGDVRISLRDYPVKKYSLKFYEDDDSFLFELKEVTGAPLIISKSNFYHSGWFKFELYDDGNLVEKNRFYIPKDF